MLNSVIIMGRLTADPELRTTENGKSVTSFTVAVERDYVKKGEDRQTDFIYVKCWNKTADFVTRFFKKGQMIAVQGSLQVRNYEDKNGNKRTACEVIADSVNFCGDKMPNTQVPPSFSVIPDNGESDPFGNTPFGSDPFGDTDVETPF